jgi:predicted Zn finger-like uncharacterized protein
MARAVPRRSQLARRLGTVRFDAGLAIMDVTCNRCSTSYEFEETLIAATGTTVKCTQCGHLFKVYRGDSPRDSQSPASPSADPPAALPTRWRVRRADGSLHTLDSLGELTRLINAGQFRREDELSRTGQVWKRLGEISELAALLEPVASARTSDPPLPPPQPLERRPPDARSSAPAPPPPRSRRSTGFEVMGKSVDLEAIATPAQAPLPVLTAAPDIAPAQAPPPPAPADPPAAAPVAGHALQPAASPRAEAITPVPPRSRLWLWVVLVCAAIAGAGGAVTQVLRVETPPAPPPVSPVVSLVARADSALAAFRAPQFEQAIALYRQALPSFPDDAHLLSALSRAYAQYAESLRTSAAISARIANGAKAGASLDDLPEALRLAHVAKLYGQRAAQRNPGNEEAGVALSDALRLTGNLVAARAEIDRVRATQRVPDAETLRVAALLAIDEAKGDLAAGRKLAGLAVAHDPPRAR